MRAKGNNPPFFLYRKSTLPMAKVSDIIKTLSEQDLKWEEALFSSREKKDKDVRESEICWIKDDILKNFIYYKFESANSDPQWGYELTDIEHIQYTKYKTNGHYDWHADIGPGLLSKRKISITVQLSEPDEYEGGDLEIFKGGSMDGPFPTAKREAGLVFVFPSFMMHRVTPVTKGVRKSFVIWLGGSHYR